MKRIFSLILCILLLLSLSVNTLAADKANLILEYNGNAIKKGDTLTVSFIIDNNSGFGTVSAKIGFNKNNLELTSVKKVFKPSGNYINVHVDSIIANAKKTGEYLVGYSPDLLSEGNFTDPITYNGVLAELTFVAKNDCLPEVYFERTELYLDDMAMTDVPYTTQIKKVRVLENPSSDIKTSSTASVNNSTDTNISSNQSITVSEGASVITPSGTTSAVIYCPPETLEEDVSDTPKSNNPLITDVVLGNLLIIGIVLGATAILVAVAIITKKLKK